MSKRKEVKAGKKERIRLLLNNLLARQSKPLPEEQQRLLAQLTTSEAA